MIVDVVVTSWNQQSYLRAAVDSALNQRNAQTRVIVVDDASDHRLPPLPSHVQVIQRPERGGQGACLNTGLQACTAEFVTILDGDDLFPSYRVAALVDAVADADMAYGGQIVFNDGDQPVLDLSPDAAPRLALRDVGPLSGTCLFRRELVLRAGPLPEGRHVGTFIQWVAHMRNLRPAPREVAIDLPVLLRRSHDANTTRTHTQHFHGYFDAIAAHRKAHRE